MSGEGQEIQVEEGEEAGASSAVLVDDKEEDSNVVRINLDAAAAPVLKKRSIMCQRSARVADLQNLLHSRLRLEKGRSVVLVVEKCFTPTLDQELGTLFDNFSRDGALHVTYGYQAAFG